MRHHAIVVTSFNKGTADAARERAVAIFTADDKEGMCGDQMVTPVMGEVTNGYCSFAILPDGSKERWDTSAAGDRARAEFIEYMNSQRYSDGSSPLDWVEVQYGDDCKVTRVVSHSDEPARPVEPAK